MLASFERLSQLTSNYFFQLFYNHAAITFSVFKRIQKFYCLAAKHREQTWLSKYVKDNGDDEVEKSEWLVLS